MEKAKMEQKRLPLILSWEEAKTAAIVFLYLQKTCPTNISVDKIEFLCTRKNDNKIIYLSDYNDEITANSFNMLNEFNDLLK